ncbi:zinc transporter ZIP1-like [Gigantopelta aegis]|uniref:zinc transporter ZIP1-like n=1 Tax=Gigantopelta aegis TaxID=1735272 RepID=UPI001B88A274|nr:zinc transporter ZIP1-like [Gigantopelta aegis]
MDKVEVKIISTLVIFLVTLLGGVVPFFFLRNYLANNKGRADDKVKLLKSFAAGIFLGTCLLHLLPEARSALTAVLGHTDYPVTELTVGLGFLLLFVIENVAIACQETKDPQETPVKFIKAKGTAVHSSCSSVEDGPDSSTYVHYGSVSDSLTSESDLATNDGGSIVATLPIENGLCKRKEIKPLLDNNQIIFGEATPGSDKSALVYGQKQHHDGHHHDHHRDHHSHHHHSHHHHLVKITGLRSIMLLLALSLHTIFDGLVIGLQATTVLVWTLLAAMSVHKTLVAFSLGLSFLESHYGKVKEAMLYLFVFSLVAPVGVGIGTIVTEAQFNQEAKSYSAGILQAVATGTFMYVTFLEGLRETFTGKYHLVNVFMVIVGFACTCALRLAADGD